MLELLPGNRRYVGTWKGKGCTRGFEEGLAGGGWRQTKPPKAAKNVPQ